MIVEILVVAGLAALWTRSEMMARNLRQSVVDENAVQAAKTEMVVAEAAKKTETVVAEAAKNVEQAAKNVEQIAKSAQQAAKNSLEAAKQSVRSERAAQSTQDSIRTTVVDFEKQIEQAEEKALKRSQELLEATNSRLDVMKQIAELELRPKPRNTVSHKPAAQPAQPAAQVVVPVIRQSQPERDPRDCEAVTFTHFK